MTKNPNNVAVWCMHRSGSTHFAQRITRSMELIYGKEPDVANLGEATGSSGFVSTKLSGSGIWGELHGHLHMGAEFVCPHVRWEFDENKKINTNRGYTGSVNEEIRTRPNIIQSAEWTNHLVCRNLRWPAMNHVSKIYDQAFASSDRFHHVVLWRKDLLDWLCSRFIFRMTGTPHGYDLEYDGIEYNIDQEYVMDDFLKKISNYVADFQQSLTVLPKDRTVIVETVHMNNVHEIDWLDHTHLDLIDAERVRHGATVWTSKETKQRVRPIDMISADNLAVFKAWATKTIRDLDWTNLDKASGFTVL